MCNLQCRRVDKEVAHQLDAAVQAAKAASPQLLAVACHAAANAVAEVQSAAALQEIMAGRLEAGPLPTVQELNRAIIAAARFPNLAVSLTPQHRQMMHSLHGHGCLLNCLADNLTMCSSRSATEWLFRTICCDC